MKALSLSTFDLGTFHEADPDAEERTVIGGNFTYIGGDDIDHVDLNNIHVQGDLDVDLGEGIPFFGDPQKPDNDVRASSSSGR